MHAEAEFCCDAAVAELSYDQVLDAKDSSHQSAISSYILYITKPGILDEKRSVAAVESSSLFIGLSAWCVKFPTQI